MQRSKGTVQLVYLTRSNTIRWQRTSAYIGSWDTPTAFEIKHKFANFLPEVVREINEHFVQPYNVLERTLRQAGSLAARQTQAVKFC